LRVLIQKHSQPRPKNLRGPFMQATLPVPSNSYNGDLVVIDRFRSGQPTNPEVFGRMPDCRPDTALPMCCRALRRYQFRAPAQSGTRLVQCRNAMQMSRPGLSGMLLRPRHRDRERLMVPLERQPELLALVLRSRVTDKNRISVALRFSQMLRRGGDRHDSRTTLVPAIIPTTIFVQNPVLLT
jgi:hypothetical protein